MTVTGFAIKPNFVSVVLVGNDGVPEPVVLNSTHPTFKRIVRALKAKDFKRVPKLISVAEAVAEQTHGNVRLKKDGVYYRGTLVNSALTHKIEDLLREHKPISPMLKFMDNLYANPDQKTIDELYEWLNSFNGGKFVPTDDGCFLAYKAVRADYKDVYTGTVDNTPGQRPIMPRKDVDPDRRNECSHGFHFCSLRYLSGFSGEKIIAVKVNPRDVVAIPRDYGCSKGRCWTYESLCDVASKDRDTVMSEAKIMLQTVAPVAKERKELLARFLELPLVKRYIKRGKMNKVTIRKTPLARLAAQYQKFAAMSTPVDRSKLFDNPLLFVRESAGLTRGEVAEELGLSYKDVYNMEATAMPTQEKIDLYLEAVAKLQKGMTTCRHASYPKPVVGKRAGFSESGGAYTNALGETAVVEQQDDVDEYGYVYEGEE